ncbi:MAG TPA: hypothetical protein ENF41_00815 [Candidatus Bathyarchaeota archaeon]|nr:hypothetical protein [Candidatus Bathyarchaeota archaeon]
MKEGLNVMQFGGIYEFKEVPCPLCGYSLIIPVFPGYRISSRCPRCGGVLYIAVGRDGEIRIRGRSYLEVVKEEVLRIAKENINKYLEIGGKIYCSYCGYALEKPKIEVSEENGVIEAYTVCPKCGGKMSWATQEISRGTQIF